MDTPPPLDEAALARLVDRFYAKVRRDPALGPIFEGAVHDWDEHLRLLTDFWSSVALGTRRFRGNPMAAHRALPSITAAHFSHWLALWNETTAEELPPAHAQALRQYAARIGESLQYGLGLDPRRQGRPLDLPVRGAAD